MTTLATGLVVLDPTAGPAVERATRAVRPASLAGLRIGFVDNSKRNSERILQFLDEMLHERYGTGPSLHRRKPTASRVVPPALLEEMLLACDVVVPGVGD
jgi:hypothetical protein